MHFIPNFPNSLSNKLASTIAAFKNIPMHWSFSIIGCFLPQTWPRLGELVTLEKRRLVAPLPLSALLFPLVAVSSLPSIPWLSCASVVSHRKNSRVRIRSAGEEDSGNYTCVVENLLGKDNSTGTVHVQSSEYGDTPAARAASQRRFCCCHCTRKRL